jgi:hypothetical protein
VFSRLWNKLRRNDEVKRLIAKNAQLEEALIDVFSWDYVAVAENMSKEARAKVLAVLGEDMIRKIAVSPSKKQRLEFEERVRSWNR